MSSFLQTAMAFALAVIPWLFPDLKLATKAISSLLIALISCIVYCIYLTIKRNELNKELISIKQNRDALAAQFDEKTDLILRYRRAFQNILTGMQIACVNTKEVKIKTLYVMVLSAQNEVNDDGGK